MTKLKGPTKVCKLCFKEISEDSFYTLIRSDVCLCGDCYEKLIPRFINFDVEGYKALALYNYDEVMTGRLYQFKGCFDIELRDTFISRFKTELKIYYRGYSIIPIPSFELDNRVRGFNHVEEIAKELGLPIINGLVKTEKFKQAEHSQKDRQEISKFIKMVEGVSIKGKNILLLDDVYTTGSTMKSALKIIEENHPNKIKILVISKTVFDEKKKVLKKDD